MAAVAWAKRGIPKSGFELRLHTWGIDRKWTLSF